jgi:hypothetical protein
MPLGDIFTKLKSTILKTKTVDVDNQLDRSVENILKLKSSNTGLGYTELIKQLANRDEFKIDSVGMFSHGARPEYFGQTDRLQRYLVYESIIRNISYAYRALTVIVDNIIAPDDITKRSIDVSVSSGLGEESEIKSFVSTIKDVIESLGITNNIDSIIKGTLKFGDFFVEVTDSETALTSKSFLSESSREELYRNKTISEFVIRDEKDGNVDITVRLHNWYLNEDKNQKQTLKDTKIILHHPKNIVRLQSIFFNDCLGYLAFPHEQFPGQASLGIAPNTVDNVCKQILVRLRDSIPNIDDLQHGKELKSIIEKVLQSQELRSIVNVRYVPPNRMQHFKLPSTKFFPYGESIFYPVEFLSKLLISLETALAVQRISRSTEKRLIGIEMGLPRDAKKLVEQLKQDFRKRKVSINSFGQLDMIPSTISTFEDVYLPQKDGKKFVEIETLAAGNVDIRSKVDELNFIRDSIVASLNVPPAFIGLEQNVSNKATLTEENINFTRSIINFQRIFGNQLRDLVNKICEILYPELTLTYFNEIYISFPAPKSLQFERQSRQVQEIVSMIQSLQSIGVPLEYSKKKFLPHFDWAEVDSENTDKNIEKITKGEEGEPGMGGVGGGMSF